MIKRIIEGKFIEIDKNYKEKCENLVYEKDNKEISLYLIDINGENKKRDLAKIYYKNADYIIMGYDVTNKNSFQELIDYWHNQIKKFKYNNFIYLLGNKIDLQDNIKVRVKEGKLFADINNFKFFSISVKNNINVQNFIDDLQTNLEKNIINKTNNDINEIIYGNPSKFCYKVVLLGDSGIGSKTSFINTAVHGKFDPNVESTNGASYATKVIDLNDNTKIILDIWDTAGQEKYKALTRFFLKDSDCIILGFDITNSDSFDNIKTFWLEFSKENSETDLFYLVGNKIDLIEYRHVPEDEARQYSEQNNMRYFEISCLTSEGIDELFNDIRNQLIKRY